MTEADLVKLDRTKNAADTDDTDGTVRLNFLPAANLDEEIFSSFADCFYTWKSEWSGEKGDVPTAWDPAAQTDFELIDSVFPTIDLVEFLWLSEECNGICDSGLFSFAGVTADGIPEKSCKSATSVLFARNGETVFGWLIVATIFTGLAWLIHLSMCCPFKKRKDNIQDVIKQKLK